MALPQITLTQTENEMPQEKIDAAHKRLAQAFDRLERAVKINRLRGVALNAEREKLQVMLNELQQHYDTLQSVSEEVSTRLDHSLAAIESELQG